MIIYIIYDYLQFLRSENEQIINDPTCKQTEIIQTDDVNTNNTEAESTNNCVSQVKKSLYILYYHIYLGN